jgi:hypothetical protein
MVPEPALQPIKRATSKPMVRILGSRRESKKANCGSKWLSDMRHVTTFSTPTPREDLFHQWLPLTEEKRASPLKRVQHLPILSSFDNEVSNGHDAIAGRQVHDFQQRNQLVVAAVDVSDYNRSGHMSLTLTVRFPNSN